MLFEVASEMLIPKFSGGIISSVKSFFLLRKNPYIWCKFKIFKQILEGGQEEGTPEVHPL